MINLWKEGFQTESYKVKALTLMNEMELLILSDYCLSFMVTYDKEAVGPDGEKIITKYQKLDQDKIKSLMKSKDEEFIEKLDEITTLLTDLLGEDEVRPLKVFEMFFTIPAVYYEINEFKTSLKKK